MTYPVSTPGVLGCASDACGLTELHDSDYLLIVGNEQVFTPTCALAKAKLKGPREIVGVFEDGAYRSVRPPSYA